MDINIIPDRRCDVCGKPVYAGMTDDDGSFYCHNDCFEKYMDDTYGKHNWMSVKDDGMNGYYVVKWDDEPSGLGFIGTGIYYTEWYDSYYEDMLEALDRGAEVIVVSEDERPDVVSALYWKQDGVYHMYSRMRGEKTFTRETDRGFVERIKQYVNEGAHVFVRG